MTPGLQTVANSLMLGGLYASVAVGLSIVMGVVRVVNLSHGHLVVLGGYYFWAMSTRFGAPLFVSILLGIPLFYFLGVAVQSGLLNRLSGRGEAPQLLTTLGLAVIIESLLLLVFTPDARRIWLGPPLPSLGILNLKLPALSAMTFVSGMLLLGCLGGILYHTRTGKAVRAAADNEIAASLCGISVKKIRCHAMGIATVTAMVAGLLVGGTFTFYPHTGGRYLMIAFGVVVIGGIGSIRGALAGGFFLAFCQLVGGGFFGPGFQEISGLLGLLGILCLRPKGLWETS
jgi:branched-chain amino acid transport system permease protein